MSIEYIQEGLVQREGHAGPSGILLHEAGCGGGRGGMEQPGVLELKAVTASSWEMMTH